MNARHLKPLETQRVHQTTVPSTSSTTISKLPNHSTRSTSSTTLSRPLTSTCLSSPDYQGQDHQHEFSHKATDTLINEVKIRIYPCTCVLYTTIFLHTKHSCYPEYVDVKKCTSRTGHKLYFSKVPPLSFKYITSKGRGRGYGVKNLKKIYLKCIRPMF